MIIINIKDFMPLTSHQVGIKIKTMVLDIIKSTNDSIILDFNEVDICTDSFSQQLTTILAREVTFTVLKERVKFKNLNSFLQEMIKANLYKALKNEKQ